MDTYYYVQMTNPLKFLVRELPELFRQGISPQAPPLEFPAHRIDLYSKFSPNYSCIRITAGLPRNDYGQTVSLLRRSDYKMPDVEKLKRFQIPTHLVSEGLSLTPSGMTGWYGYNRVVDSRSSNKVVTEEYFFEYVRGYVPDTFSKLQDSLGGLRYLSNIMHALDIFEIIQMSEGTYVRLTSRPRDSNKPEFFMGS